MHGGAAEYLGGGHRGGEVGGTAAEKSGVGGREGHGAAANYVAHKGNAPGPDHLAIGHLVLVPGGGDRGAVAGEELSAGRRDEEEVARKEGRKSHLDEARVGFGQAREMARHDEAEEAGEPYVGTAQDGLVQHLAVGFLGILHPLLGEGIVGILGRFEHGGRRGHGSHGFGYLRRSLLFAGVVGITTI